jgi:hypothetical protein
MGYTNFTFISNINRITCTYLKNRQVSVLEKAIKSSRLFISLMAKKSAI